MAKYIEGMNIAANIEELIKHSERFVCLVSPYLQIPVGLRNQLKILGKKGVEVRVIYKHESKINVDDLTFFKENPHVKLFICENLHAKCYISDKAGVITSFNLYEFSRTNNFEMGVLFTADSDCELYSDTMDAIGRIGLASTRQTDFSIKPQATVTTTPKPSKKKTPIPEDQGFFGKFIHEVVKGGGYCIRCKRLMDYDLNKPLCSECFPIWNRYAKTDYKEKFCHSCGREYRSSYGRPTCYECYMASKDS